MKRLLVVCSLIFILVPCLSGWTMWVNNISEGEWVYFNVGSFSPSGAPISYQTLSDICASCNQNIVDHNFDKMYPFYDYPSHRFVAEIVTMGSYSVPRYVIRLRDTSSNPISSLYFVDDKLYYVYAIDDTKNPHTLGPIFDRLNTLLSYVDGIEGFIDGLENGLSTISSRLNTVGNRLLKTVDNTSYTAADLLYNSWRQLQTIGGYVDNVEDKLTSQISLLTSLNSNVVSLASMVDAPYFSSALTDGTNPYPYQLIPADSASSIISYLNLHYSGKDVKVIARNGSLFDARFNRAWLDGNRHITISAFNYVQNDSFNYYLCDVNHVLFQVSANPYDSVLSRIETAIGQVSIDIDNSSSSSTTNITTLVTPITTMVTTTANINTKLDSLVGKLDINIGSIVDHLDLGFGDVVDAIQALPSSDVSALIPYVDQLEPYTDDIERLLTYNNTSLTNLSLYTDDLEGLVSTSNSSLSNISSYSEDISTYCDSILQTNQAILAHLDSSDLTDDFVISSLVDDWGDHLVYIVLNSDNVLSLFNAAFGDLPSNLEWGQARIFFEHFYRGEE